MVKLTVLFYVCVSIQFDPLSVLGVWSVALLMWLLYLSIIITRSIGHWNKV